MGATSAPPETPAASFGRKSVRAKIARPGREAQLLWVAVVVFILVSVSWLLQDDRVPDYDSGIHMVYAAVAQGELATGHVSAPFTDYNTYPPLVHLLGAISIFLVGMHPMALILASNLVFVPMLAFGCYGVGKLTAGPRAGLLAGLLALGSPMFVSMMHEYDLDPPQAALIAMTVWAILASRRFERIGISALAGALLGLALLTKETSVVFVAGLLAVVLLRGGWRSWRGLMAFAFMVENVAGPWYVYHAVQLQQTFTAIGGLAPNSVQAPPRFSTANVGWYIWNLLNVQTLSIFGAMFFIGAIVALWRCVRPRLDAENVYPELLGGVFVSYLGMTYLIHKDPRYSLPALVYVAVLATSWTVTIRRPVIRRGLAVGVSALAAIYVAGMSFGIDATVRIALPGAQETIIHQRQLTLYETDGWVRGGPVTDGHILTLMRGLKASGINALVIDADATELDFNANGLNALAASAEMYVAPPGAVATNMFAYTFLHKRRRREPAPCQTLNDGMGVYVVRGAYAGLSPQTLHAIPTPGAPLTYRLVCPGRTPVIYRPPA